MKGAYLVATNTVRQIVRQKLFLNLILLGIAMVALATIVSNITFGFHDRVIRSIALSGVSISLNLMAVLVGVGLVHGEIERRTLFVILTRPVSRMQYVAGRFLGLLAVLTMVLVGMGFIMSIVLLSFGVSIDGIDAAAIIAMLPEAAVLGAVATVFSSFSTPTLSVGFSIGTWLIAASTDDLVGLTPNDSPLKPALRVIAYVVPSLARFNFREAAVYRMPIAASDLAFSIVYGGLFAAALVIIAGVILSRREMV